MRYQKINSIYKRDENKKIILGEYSLPEYKYLENNEWFFTEKIDGTNIRLYFNTEEGTIIKGREDTSDVPKKLMTALERVCSTIENDVYNQFNGCEVELIGEGFGAGIQKIGSKYREDNGFILFDVVIDHRPHGGELKYLSRYNVEETAYELGLEVAPVLLRGTLLDAIDLVKSGNLRSSFGDFIPEGLVGMPSVPIYDRHGNRIITKIKHKDLLAGFK